MCFTDSKEDDVRFKAFFIKGFTFAELREDFTSKSKFLVHAKYRSNGNFMTTS